MLKHTLKHVPTDPPPLVGKPPQKDEDFPTKPLDFPPAWDHRKDEIVKDTVGTFLGQTGTYELKGWLYRVLSRRPSGSPTFGYYTVVPVQRPTWRMQLDLDGAHPGRFRLVKPGKGPMPQEGKEPAPRDWRDETADLVALLKSGKYSVPV